MTLPADVGDARWAALVSILKDDRVLLLLPPSDSATTLTESARHLRISVTDALTDIDQAYAPAKYPFAFAIRSDGLQKLRDLLDLALDAPYDEEVIVVLLSMMRKMCNDKHVSLDVETLQGWVKVLFEVGKALHKFIEGGKGRGPVISKAKGLKTQLDNRMLLTIAEAGFPTGDSTALGSYFLKQPHGFRWQGEVTGPEELLKIIPNVTKSTAAFRLDDGDAHTMTYKLFPADALRLNALSQDIRGVLIGEGGMDGVKAAAGLAKLVQRKIQRYVKFPPILLLCRVLSACLCDIADEATADEAINAVLDVMDAVKQSLEANTPVGSIPHLDSSTVKAATPPHLKHLFDTTIPEDPAAVEAMFKRMVAEFGKRRQEMVQAEIQKLKARRLKCERVTLWVHPSDASVLDLSDTCRFAYEEGLAREAENLMEESVVGIREELERCIKEHQQDRYGTPLHYLPRPAADQLERLGELLDAMSVLAKSGCGAVTAGTREDTLRQIDPYDGKPFAVVASEAMGAGRSRH
ncbi:hypothetical protein M409DRAFT_23736 [Zasmidium cellare ATCC 36951]|uniref:Uncharacterized protein n=1 Tax=Zasmidium cellare ATCC 36951 TaxID=1080233 RepID=A0A6A6CIK3_ZASCE|nr:uncharacterized protein M409DRAFT_23736 [Zasmidium cellare ATCC 36951]KAF2166008.1 hypothetical protein M409DRAFT_23736 [Zasmidium cellare ATCC 36951]